MSEAEFNVGEYVYHNSFGVGKIVRPEEREGKPGFMLDFKDRRGHFMSTDILRRTQRTHPDGLRVFAYENQTEATRLMQEDPSAIVIRAIGQVTAPLERPEIERILVESQLVSGPEQFKTWWGKALTKLKASLWLEITLQGSRVFVRRLDKPRTVAVPPPPPSRNVAPVGSPPTSVSPAPLTKIVSPPANSTNTAPAPKPISSPTPLPASPPITNANGENRPIATTTTSLVFDPNDFRRQLRLIEQAGDLPEEAKTYLLGLSNRPDVPPTNQFEALLTVFQKGGLTKPEVLERIEGRAQSGIGLEQIGDAGIRNDIGLLLLEENNLSPVLLQWLSGSFVSDLTLAELVMDRLVELHQFDILAKSIEKLTNPNALLGAELEFVRWMSQKEPNLAALALSNGYPWSPASLSARITRLFLALVEMEGRDDKGRESRKEGLIETARLLENRSARLDPATVTRLVQTINTSRPRQEKLIETFLILQIQPDKPIVAKLLKYVENNVANLDDSVLAATVLQLEVSRGEGADFGLVYWWLGQVVRLKNLKLARQIFELLLARLNRAVNEDEQLRCIFVLLQMIDLELINQNQVGSLRIALDEIIRKISGRKLKVNEEQGFLLNELIEALRRNYAILQ